MQIAKESKMGTKRILVFPAGSEIGLEIYNALKFSKDIELFGATSAEDHSGLVYERLIANLPTIENDNFVEHFSRAISEYDIDYVYPALDSVQLFLLENEASLPAQIISSPLETVYLCRSKRRTYDFFKDCDFVPKTFTTVDASDFPVFVKPAIGQGSQGARLISDEKELEFEKERNEDLLICENLPGAEYTIDCLTMDGDLTFIGPRQRSRVRAGISVRSTREDCDLDICAIANTINERLDLIGAWFFQLKKDKQGNFKLLEIEPRIAGTMALSRVNGVNLPLLSIYALENVKCRIIDNELNLLIDKAFVNRYSLAFDFNYIYIDLDDTIIVKGKVNIYAIAFLYQALNTGKKAILLTKHKGNVIQELKHFKIDPGLFDEIITLEQDDQKWKQIRYHNSIFIDDSFSERTRVREMAGIPVFDLDAIEGLLDWRA